MFSSLQRSLSGRSTVLRLSIPAKIFLAFAVVIASFGTVSIFAVARMHRIAEGLSLVTRTYQPLTRLGAQLESSHRSSEQATARILGEKDVRTQRALLLLARDYHPRATREQVRAAARLIAQARELSFGGGEEVFLDRIDGLLDAALLRYDEYARVGRAVELTVDELEAAQQKRRGARIADGELWEAGTPAENGAPMGERSAEKSAGSGLDGLPARELAFANEEAALRARLESEVRQLKKIEVIIVARLSDFASELDERIALRIQEAGREERRTALLVVVFSLAAIVVGFLATAASQRILAPIAHLRQATRELGEGRFRAELEVGSDDDLGQLAREFNAMAQKLADRERQLAEKSEELLRSERLAAIGRLASQITHEIRNPLSSISLNTELLEEYLAQGAAELSDEHSWDSRESGDSGGSGDFEHSEPSDPSDPSDPYDPNDPYDHSAPSDPPDPPDTAREPSDSRDSGRSSSAICSPDGRFSSGNGRAVPQDSVSLVDVISSDNSDPDSDNSDEWTREEAVSIIAAISREVERLTEVTEEYLRFARLPKAKLAPLDLKEALDEHLDFLTPELEDAGVALSRELSEEGLVVWADRDQLRQALLNLLRNAREAAGEGGEVLLRAWAEESGWVHFEVHDNGPGVPQELQESLFEPFFSTKQRGTGLGLSLLQQIAHEHGGKVEYRRSPLGGALFVVSLRRMTGEQPERA